MPSVQEATEAIKPILGKYYSFDQRNVLQALWQEICLCHFVSREQQTGSGVLWFNTLTKDDAVQATAAAAAGFNPEKAAKVK